MPRIRGIKAARDALCDGSGIGQSDTEVSEEAVAGNDAAAAMTVARIASGERSIGGWSVDGG